MANCRCAKCRRREIYNATGMTLSLAWNKKLSEICYVEKLAKDAERHRPDNSVSQGRQPSERRPGVLHASRLGQLTATGSSDSGCEVGFDQKRCRAKCRLESKTAVSGAV
jgi:hypothetical protein